MNYDESRQDGWHSTSNGTPYAMREAEYIPAISSMEFSTVLQAGATAAELQRLANADYDATQRRANRYYNARQYTTVEDARRMWAFVVTHDDGSLIDGSIGG